MKILFVSPYPPARDGIGTYTCILARAFRDIGHEVRIVVPRPAQNSSDNPREVIGSVSGRDEELAAQFESIVRWQPDVVHVQFAVAAFGAGVIALIDWLDALRQKLPVPVIATFHEVAREIGLLRVVGRALYRRIAARCDGIIAHTSASYAAVTSGIGVAPGKVVVIPHMCVLPPAATSTADQLRDRFGLRQKKILLAFGFIHVDKGLDDLIRALRMLHRGGAGVLQDVRLVVAGSVRRRHGVFRVFEFRDWLHLRRVLLQARRKGILRHLVMTGYVPDGDIAAWFDAAEAVVLPYRRTEQSGIAALASAFGVPVLASDVGGLGEQFAGSPWMFPPRAPARLAQTLANFLRAAPADRAATVLARYPADLESVIARTFEFYGVAIRSGVPSVH